MAASADPLILSCEGASGDAARAAALADTLAAAGLGTRADRPVVGARLIAVDGCAGACCSRRLESIGRRPTAVVDAFASRTPAAAIATTRLQLKQGRPHGHRVRRLPPPAAPAAHGTHSVRDYLLALDELTRPLVECGILAPGLPALASHVSQLLGVSRASAGEMLQRLEKLGLVTRTDGRQLLLSDAGRHAADCAVYRHRILEVFAVDTLAYEIADSFETARAFDAAFDDEAIERLATSLGHPNRCPHGWPVDPLDAHTIASTLQALDTVGGRQTATVVALSERPAAALRELAASGVEPGTLVGVRTRERLSSAARRAALVSTVTREQGKRPGTLKEPGVLPRR